MTGRLTWSAEPARVDRAHLRARFDLDRGTLLFHDTRRFGTFCWHHTAEEARPAGIDPLSPELTPARMAGLLERSRQNLKAWLLRQDRLVGLGNIYASEILHAARISPRRSADTLKDAEVRALLRSTRRVLRRAIENCGTTFSDFQDARGLTGSYQQYLAVYGRAGERCRRCRGTVRRAVQQQRSTFFCPGCQR
jgi:formamidopyrimidine-DNA glycosylase